MVHIVEELIGQHADVPPLQTCGRENVHDLVADHRPTDKLCRRDQASLHVRRDANADGVGFRDGKGLLLCAKTLVLCDSMYQVRGGSSAAYPNLPVGASRE